MINEIQITGSEDNMANGLGSLMNQSTSFHCLADEVYIVSDEAVKKLKEDKIEFIIVKKGNSIVHDIEVAKKAPEGCGEMILVDASDPNSESWQCGQYYDALKKTMYCGECKESAKKRRRKTMSMDVDEEIGIAGLKHELGLEDCEECEDGLEHEVIDCPKCGHQFCSTCGFGEKNIKSAQNAPSELKTGQELNSLEAKNGESTKDKIKQELDKDYGKKEV